MKRRKSEGKIKMIMYKSNEWIPQTQKVIVKEIIFEKMSELIKGIKLQIEEAKETQRRLCVAFLLAQLWSQAQWTSSFCVWSYWSSWPPFSQGDLAWQNSAKLGDCSMRQGSGHIGSAYWVKSLYSKPFTSLTAKTYVLRNQVENKGTEVVPINYH